MRNSFKTMLILALGAGMATLSSCTEDEGNDPDPVAPVIVCYPTTITTVDDEDDTETTKYEYNDENQLIKSTYAFDGGQDITTFTYTDGKLATATSGDEVSTFIYDAGSDIPSRINITNDGEDVGFTVITSTGANITKVENSYYQDNEAILSDVTTLTYTGGQLTGAKTENYDADSETFTTEVELSDFVFDGKKSPYNGNFAFAFEQDFNPLTLVPSNIVSANLVAELEGQEIKLPYTGTYTYNENEYPVTSTQEISGFFGTDFTFEYDCK